MTQPVDMSDPATWPDDLDALIAAPDHHTLLFEDDRVRVLDTVIRAGDRTPVHSHRWPAISASSASSSRASGGTAAGRGRSAGENVAG